MTPIAHSRAGHGRPDHRQDQPRIQHLARRSHRLRCERPGADRAAETKLSGLGCVDAICDRWSATNETPFSVSAEIDVDWDGLVLLRPTAARLIHLGFFCCGLHFLTDVSEPSFRR